jgi:IS30 family transposase
MPKRLSPALEREVRRLAARGHSQREIGSMIERSKHAVSNVLTREPRPAATTEWNPSSARLSLREREEIRGGLERGESCTVIARLIGRAVSTVSREVAANGGRGDYQAWRAHRRAAAQARRPKQPKLAHAPLATQVTAWLEEWWSPEAIAHRLRIEFPYDPLMWVSQETIYQSLFVQGRGELRRELHRCLRSGRARRRPRSRIETRGTIPDKVMISERPAEVADRAVPGHWEGDLLSGARNRSAVGTLVERTTRYLLLLHLPDGRSAEEVNKAMKRAITALPDALRRTITWDQGLQRKHQRPAAPVPPEGHRSVGAQRPGPRPDRAEPQQPCAQDAWIHDTIREAHRASCDDRLNPP